MPLTALMWRVQEEEEAWSAVGVMGVYRQSE